MSDAICSLQLNGRNYLAVAGAMVDEAVATLGLPSHDAAQLRCITEELAAAVVENAFDPDEEVSLVVSVMRQPGGVAVVLRDQGAPSQLAAAGSHPPRLTDLIRLGFADELQFNSLGLEGNSATIFRRLPYQSVDEDLDLVEPSHAPSIDSGDEIEYRPLTSEDTIGVARLFYRVHGYTAYQSELVYQPERFAEFIESGHHVGTIAVVQGRVVGHIASTIEHPGDKVGLIGMLAVDPVYRQFGIGAKLSITHGLRLIEMGFIGQYSTCVTIHVASQKISLKFDGHEVALLLAYRLASIEFKGFDEDDHESKLRRTNVMFYNGLGQEIVREIHVPPEYQEITAALYENAKLPRTVTTASARQPDDVPEHSTIDLILDHREFSAVLKVKEYGRDFLTAVQERLGELCLNRFEVIRLLMHTSDEKTAYFGSGLRELGFFYAGIFPEYDDGDSLVLQYLNNVELNPDEVLMASEFGQRLRDFVLADKTAALANDNARRRSRAHMARIYEALDRD